jgi:hypothetical protein
MEVDMKNILFIRILNSAIASIIAVTIMLTLPAYAANDPSIKGALRDNIKANMMTFIEDRMVDDTYIIYDAVEGRIMKLKYDKLHDGIIKKGDYYVSCADFHDENGKKVDLDFLVIQDGDHLRTLQAVVHSVDGKKRKYHLEG